VVEAGLVGLGGAGFDDGDDAGNDAFVLGPGSGEPLGDFGCASHEFGEAFAVEDEGAAHEASAEPAKSVVSPRQTARSAANDA
jgi:hypothetical protein